VFVLIVFGYDYHGVYKSIPMLSIHLYIIQFTCWRKLHHHMLMHILIHVSSVSYKIKIFNTSGVLLCLVYMYLLVIYTTYFRENHSILCLVHIHWLNTKVI